MNMYPERVLEIASGIREMKIRGAGRIARATAEALKIAALSYNGVEDLVLFKKYMVEVGELLISTRPTAISLPNTVVYVLSSLRNSSSFSEARESVVKRADNFIRESEEATKRISLIGAKRIKENSIVLTHCHSTAAVGVIIEAYKQGRVVRVYSTETRPFYQGRVTYTQLAKSGVPVVQIPDSAVRYIINEVDYVVVGADTVTSNGAVVNKIGTSQVALAAKEARTRVYVAAESYKFSPLTLIGELVTIEYRSPEEIVSREWIEKHPRVKVLNPVFDVTPPEYIDAIITEYGVIPPQAAVLILVEKLGWALDVLGYSEGKLDLKRIVAL
ncbi:MAG: ribose 1,5-bisphosphate isomerase [Desulfurococcaceae archaeon]|jgi:ribose 1,5-bisphosphate isomerase|nr:ribose 1,5-bisphosphate isomerase [Desulfurococcaceae archaeon]